MNSDGSSIGFIHFIAKTAGPTLLTHAVSLDCGAELEFLVLEEAAIRIVGAVEHRNDACIKQPKLSAALCSSMSCWRAGAPPGTMSTRRRPQEAAQASLLRQKTTKKNCSITAKESMAASGGR